MKMTDSIFDCIINTAQDCVFWKDKERRFVGVNQAFLDFYGFESDEILIGKTDEDMGWHSNPEPYKQDELNVLKGSSTYKVQGKCIVKGEERDIIASKRPIYDGEEIIGLVGSFMDITDVVRRKNMKSNMNAMYTVEQLRKYEYFDKLLDEIRIEDILDPLTGVVSRGYIQDFVHSLISKNTPFTFVIIDLDNFKYFNDTYGHHAGDMVLVDVSRGLVSFTEEYGVVGRFGGDELLLINLRDRDYQQKKEFFIKLYEKNKILRKDFKFEGNNLFITGTSGCATYPDDAKTYDELFSFIDKALFRGKNKGRNCYIIYVEEKYKDLEIKKLARRGIYTSMRGLIDRLAHVNGFENILDAAYPFLSEELQITNLYYAGKNGNMHSVLDKAYNADISDISKLEMDDLYTDNSLDIIKDTCPKLYNALNELKAEAVLIVRIGLGAKTEGYIICAEPKSKRIWQEDERGLMYFLARLLVEHIHYHGDSIPE